MTDRITKTDVRIMFGRMCRAAADAGVVEASNPCQWRLAEAGTTVGYSIYRVGQGPDGLTGRMSIDGITDPNIGQTSREAWKALWHMAHAFEIVAWSKAHSDLRRALNG